MVKGERELKSPLSSPESFEPSPQKTEELLSEKEQSAIRRISELPSGSEILVDMTPETYQYFVDFFESESESEFESEPEEKKLEISSQLAVEWKALFRACREQGVNVSFLENGLLAYEAIIKLSNYRKCFAESTYFSDNSDCDFDISIGEEGLNKITIFDSDGNEDYVLTGNFKTREELYDYHYGRMLFSYDTKLDSLMFRQQAHIFKKMHESNYSLVVLQSQNEAFARLSREAGSLPVVSFGRDYLIDWPNWTMDETMEKIFSISDEEELKELENLPQDFVDSLSEHDRLKLQILIRKRRFELGHNFSDDCPPVATGYWYYDNIFVRTTEYMGYYEVTSLNKDDNSNYSGEVKDFSGDAFFTGQIFPDGSFVFKKVYNRNKSLTTCEKREITYEGKLGDNGQIDGDFYVQVGELKFNKGKFNAYRGSGFPRKDIRIRSFCRPKELKALLAKREEEQPSRPSSEESTD